jgi:MFS family permease
MSMQPTFGRIFTFFNMKWTYIGAFLIFEVGSIICAAASTSTVFIIGRALAGVGAAGMFCGGLLIIAHAVPKIKRPLYMSTVSTMYGIAAVAGPLLGGLITDSKKLTWRFCFWLNVRKYPFHAATIPCIPKSCRYQLTLCSFRCPGHGRSHLDIQRTKNTSFRSYVLAKDCQT